MTRKIFIATLLVFGLQAPSFALIDAVFKVAGWIKDGYDNVSEEVFRNAMLANAIDQLAEFKKNYTETKKVHEELKKMKEDPEKYWKEITDELKYGFDNPVEKFWDEVDRQAGAKEAVITAAEKKALEKVHKAIQKGTKMTIEEIKKANNALKKKNTFDKGAEQETINKRQDSVKEINANIEKRRKQLKNLPTDPKKSELKLKLIQAGQEADRNRIDLLNLEMQQRRLEKEHEEELRDYLETQLYLAYLEQVIEANKPRRREIRDREKEIYKILEETPR